MGNCLSGSKKQSQNTLTGTTNERNRSEESKENSRNQENKAKNTKKTQYTFDKYGKKVPVLSDPKESGLMIRRVNSKEQIQQEV